MLFTYGILETENRLSFVMSVSIAGLARLCPIGLRHHGNTRSWKNCSRIYLLIMGKFATSSSVALSTLESIANAPFFSLALFLLLIFFLFLLVIHNMVHTNNASDYSRPIQIICSTEVHVALIQRRSNMVRAQTRKGVEMFEIVSFERSPYSFCGTLLAFQTYKREYRELTNCKYGAFLILVSHESKTLGLSGSLVSHQIHIHNFAIPASKSSLPGQTKEKNRVKSLCGNISAEA